MKLVQNTALSYVQRVGNFCEKFAKISDPQQTAKESQPS